MGSGNTVRSVIFGVKNTIPVSLYSQIQNEIPGSVHFSDKDGDFTILHRHKYTKSAEALKKAKTAMELVSVSEGSPDVTPRVIIRSDGSSYTTDSSSEGRRSLDSSITASEHSNRFSSGYHDADTSSGYFSKRASAVSTITMSSDERNGVPTAASSTTQATQSTFNKNKPLPPCPYPTRKPRHAFECIPPTFVHPGNNLGRSAHNAGGQSLIWTSAPAIPSRSNDPYRGEVLPLEVEQWRIDQARDAGYRANEQGMTKLMRNVGKGRSTFFWHQEEDEAILQEDREYGGLVNIEEGRAERARQRARTEYLESEARKRRQREQEEAEARRTAYMYPGTTPSSTQPATIQQASKPFRGEKPLPQSRPIVQYWPQNTHMTPAHPASNARSATSKHTRHVAPQASTSRVVEKELPHPGPTRVSGTTSAPVPQAARPLPLPPRPLPPQPVTTNTRVAAVATVPPTIRLVTAQPARQVLTQVPAPRVIEMESPQPEATRAARPLPAPPSTQHTSRREASERRSRSRPIAQVSPDVPRQVSIPPRSTHSPVMLQQAPIQNSIPHTTKPEPRPTGYGASRPATTPSPSRSQTTLPTPPFVSRQSRPLPAAPSPITPTITSLLAEPIESKPLPAPLKPVRDTPPKYTRVRGTNVIREVEPEPTTKSVKVRRVDRTLYLRDAPVEVDNTQNSVGKEKRAAALPPRKIRTGRRLQDQLEEAYYGKTNFWNAVDPAC
ncbi:hypothetical protein M422DRAFT_65377 [Sphaerobolus stellatus SS14]|nr:hypothetical protein M422DRAFT_65377 [Sphaerobolus stellatus SS14]